MSFIESQTNIPELEALAKQAHEELEGATIAFVKAEFDLRKTQVDGVIASIKAGAATFNHLQAMHARVGSSSPTAL